jgi:hypothetical protein
MSESLEWRVICAPGGWVRVSAAGGDAIVYMQLSRADARQRLNVHVAMMRSASPISTHAWRNVPFEEIEEFANSTYGILTDEGINPPRAVLLSPGSGDPLQLDDLDAYFGTAEELRKHDAAENRSPHVNGFWLSDLSSRDPGEEPPSLKHPGRRITDEFLTDLAATYRWLVATDHNAPSTKIAEQTGAPVATARRWVAMARKKGLLPPGRPGRAG